MTQLYNAKNIINVIVPNKNILNLSAANLPWTVSLCAKCTDVAKRYCGLEITLQNKSKINELLIKLKEDHLVKYF
jgi:hypothetical protein